MRAVLRWLGRAVGSLLTALLLVGFGFYLHFLWADWNAANLIGKNIDNYIRYAEASAALGFGRELIAYVTPE